MSAPIDISDEVLMYVGTIGTHAVQQRLGGKAAHGYWSDTR